MFKVPGVIYFIDSMMVTVLMMLSMVLVVR